MPNVVVDLDFLYLGPDASGSEFVAIHNFASSTIHTAIAFETVEVDGPVLCNYDEIYNGVGCVTNHKQLFTDSQH